MNQDSVEPLARARRAGRREAQHAKLHKVITLPHQQPHVGQLETQEGKANEAQLFFERDAEARRCQGEAWDIGDFEQGCDGVSVGFEHGEHRRQAKRQPGRAQQRTAEQVLRLPSRRWTYCPRPLFAMHNSRCLSYYAKEFTQSVILRRGGLADTQYVLRVEASEPS